MDNANKLPTFFIVGAAKSGTTALATYLREHTGIFMPTFEPHYFANDLTLTLANKPENPEGYQKLFASAGEKQLIGEKSVFYLYSKTAARNIAAFNHEAKIIILLRNPVDLVHSLHSELFYKMNEDEESFANAWQLQEKRRRGKRIPERCRLPFALQYGDVGKLSEQVQRYKEHFHPDKVRIFLSEDLKRDTLGVYKETLGFLNVSYDGRKEFAIANPNKRYKSRFIARILNKEPRLITSLRRGIKKLLGGRSTGVLKAVRDWNTRNPQREPLDPKMRKRLSEYFKEDIIALERVIGRDLSVWYREEGT